MSPLEGIKVLDMSRVLAGPWAGQLLSDLGADVIKVERPHAGDDTRHWGPPYLKDGAGEDTAEASYYLAANRGKRSIAVDIQTQDGQALIRKLAARSDILIENYKVGALRKYGLDYASLKDTHPKLIYCSITGYGETGPYADRAGYDFVIQGMSGLMSVTGTPEDEPTKVGVALADLSTGLYGVIAILAAVHQRNQTGRGQHIDMALLDTMLGLLSNQNMNYLTTGNAPTRIGNAHPNIVPYQAFETLDGHMVIACGNDHQFRLFAQIAGREDLANHPDYETNENRVRHRAALVPVLKTIFASRTTSDWVADLSAAGVPAGPINTIEDAFKDPQVIARGMVEEVAHPLGGTFPSVKTPIRFSDADLKAATPPPLLGSDGRAILSELGYGSADIEALAEAGAVVLGDT